MGKVLSDEPHKDAQLREELRARKARWAYLVWLQQLSLAWAEDDYPLYRETLAACVMLPDEIRVQIKE